MGILNEQFNQAQIAVKTLSNRPSNADLLTLYTLFKQATEGDNEAKKPSFTDMVARAKWDAWAKLEGTTLDEAKQQYIDLIESLR